MGFFFDAGRWLDRLTLKAIAPFARACHLHPVEEGYHCLSYPARALIDSAYEGMTEPFVDYHVHVIGTDTARTGNYIHPRYLSWRHPFSHVGGLIFQSAFGVTDIQQTETDVMRGLVELNRSMGAPWKFCLLAFDKGYDEKGMADIPRGNLYVANEYVFQAAAQDPNAFIPVISVHPLRPDALEELEKWSAKGAALVKWLPNAMGINPADPKCLPFYRTMQRLGLALLSHAGHESAIPSRMAQHLGNPLLLRQALDCGIKVIVAHCAGLGSGNDLDHPSGKRETNFNLFLRLARMPDYRDHLFADLASITQINRLKDLSAIIDEAQPGGALEGRLVNGSDYPLPAINALISLKLLAVKGYLEWGALPALKEIYAYNPLLFDFVLKRTLRHPKTQARFPGSIFGMHAKLRPFAITAQT